MYQRRTRAYFTKTRISVDLVQLKVTASTSFTPCWTSSVGTTGFSAVAGLAASASLGISFFSLTVLTATGVTLSWVEDRRKADRKRERPILIYVEDRLEELEKRLLISRETSALISDVVLLALPILRQIAKRKKKEDTELGSVLQSWKIERLINARHAVEKKSTKRLGDVSNAHSLSNCPTSSVWILFFP